MKLFLGLFLIASVSWSLAEETNLTVLERLENIFKTYDFSVRPSYDLDVPDKVTVTAHILSMPEIDSVKQELVLNLYFRQAWKDPRLATNDSVLILPSEFWSKIWQPDTFFVNELSAEEHVVTTPNSFVKIYRDGRVHKSDRYTLRISCPMDFRYFPFDEQTCELPIESYGHSASSIDYHWEKNVSSVTVGKFSHVEFKILGSRLFRETITLQTG
ncbi:unnamed protein product [Allacma fusca]|uniref:Neurotransmitter-gated ion-channel ligand-binding domain-containing protein n=1 Tax=Allacma fusca TaxID=39272 RepID=A0A8J2PNS0_9HEXA|nr:unnamed protein product [Allacma fusca]